MLEPLQHADVVITGAGPSGSVAAGLLRKNGHSVVVLEREQFPRFSIGESLLPQSMAYLEEAGMLRDVVEAGFQHKNGAAFAWGGRFTEFDFRDKSSKGWGTTYQVARANFDQVLATAASKAGADVRFRHEVTAVDVSRTRCPTPRLTVKSDAGTYEIRAPIVLDASGFGRLLPRLLDLELPSTFPVRQAFFTHVEDRIATTGLPFDRNKILITVHPGNTSVWFWLIPLSSGRCSVGVVAEAAWLDHVQGDEATKLKTIVAQAPDLGQRLANAVWDTKVRTLRGYASNVKSLHGDGFALLGNAGEFLDPIFSSGVTIALTSSSLAAKCAHRVLAGETVDWAKDYAEPLKRGVNAFKTFVESWYRGAFQKIIFHEQAPNEVRRYICSILAGYAWDQTNPYVAESKRRLGVLEELCA